MISGNAHTEPQAHSSDQIDDGYSQESEVNGGQDNSPRKARRTRAGPGRRCLVPVGTFAIRYGTVSYQIKWKDAADPPNGKAARGRGFWRPLDFMEGGWLRPDLWRLQRAFRNASLTRWSATRTRCRPTSPQVSHQIERLGRLRALSRLTGSMVGSTRAPTNNARIDHCTASGVVPRAIRPATGKRQDVGAALVLAQ